MCETFLLMLSLNVWVSNYSILKIGQQKKLEHSLKYILLIAYFIFRIWNYLDSVMSWIKLVYE